MGNVAFADAVEPMRLLVNYWSDHPVSLWRFTYDDSHIVWEAMVMLPENDDNRKAADAFCEANPGFEQHSSFGSQGQLLFAITSRQEERAA